MHQSKQSVRVAETRLWREVGTVGYVMEGKADKICLLTDCDRQ